MLFKQTYWHRGLRWRTWCTEVGKLPESKNLTVLYHLIMGNYYLVKKKKFLCKCADREQEQLRLSVPLKGKHYLCSKCFTRQTRCSLKGGYLGVHFESKALGPQPGSPALNSTKNHTSAEQQQLTPAESSALHIQKKNKIHKHPAERKLPKLSALLSFGGRKYGFVLHMLQAIVSQPLCLN